MMFEYIRPIDPPPARPELEPLFPFGGTTDTPDLGELVAQERTLSPEAPSLACPEPSERVELPRFSGMTLADVVVHEDESPEPPHPTVAVPLVTSLPSETRTLLGPGAMTMTLAIAATLAFGMFVVTG